MRALMLEVDEHLLAERHRLGLDKADEMWEGVLHMVPAPKSKHGEIQARLAAAFLPAADTRGMRLATEIGVIAGPHDYRVPDLAIYRREARDEEGIKRGAELVVEVRSPGDETYDKVPWYPAHGCRHVLVVDRDSLRLELSTANGRIEPDGEGYLMIESLGLRIGPARGGTLLIVYGPHGRSELRFEP